MKEFLKRALPAPFVGLIKRVLKSMRLRAAFNYDRRRYDKYFAKGRGESEENIEAHVIFHTHQIEKGLSHANFRYGFGLSALKGLSRGLRELSDKDSVVYHAGISAIRAYLDEHEKADYNIDAQRSAIGEDLVREAMQERSDLSGYITISKKSKQDNKCKNFEELFTQRYTVREFSSDPVDMQKIHSALELSLKTPTVCNRQSFRVLLVQDAETISRVLKIQNGFRGYQEPPVLALVLTDTRAFRGINERNNVYIDGGLFTMSFLLGLEYESLATCPLNTMFSVREEKEMRRILEVADYYNFIAFIAIGNFRDANKVAKSFRLPTKDIIVDK